MSKRYTVTSVPTTSGPEYVIHDNLTDTDIGFFDTQKWAESWAEVFEKRWKRSKGDGKQNKTFFGQKGHDAKRTR